MVDRSYLVLSGDKTDSRKKVIQLSDKAIEKFPVFEKVWDAGQSVVKEMLKENNEFFEALKKLEDENQKNSFNQRIEKYLENK